jgi:hypothetical protein
MESGKPKIGNALHYSCEINRGASPDSKAAVPIMDVAVNAADWELEPCA